jgi:hypothetical protein
MAAELFKNLCDYLAALRDFPIDSQVANLRGRARPEFALMIPSDTLVHFLISPPRIL